MAKEEVNDRVLRIRIKEPEGHLWNFTPAVKVAYNYIQITALVQIKKHACVLTTQIIMFHCN